MHKETIFMAPIKTTDLAKKKKNDAQLDGSHIIPRLFQINICFDVNAST